MSKSSRGIEPPKLREDKDGVLDPASLADLLEYFLNYDQRVALMRLPQVEELYQWKRADDAANGIEPAPFDNAETRFVVGSFQAIATNPSEIELRAWISELLVALGGAKEINEDLARKYGIEQGNSHVAEAQKIDREDIRGLYLSSCWIESLCTAEVRFLGWVYQELFGKPFEPLSDSEII